MKFERDLHSRAISTDATRVEAVIYTYFTMVLNPPPM